MISSQEAFGFPSLVVRKAFEFKRIILKLPERPEMLHNLPASVDHRHPVKIGPCAASRCRRVWHLFKIWLVFVRNNRLGIITVSVVVSAMYIRDIGTPSSFAATYTTRMTFLV